MLSRSPLAVTVVAATLATLGWAQSGGPASLTPAPTPTPPQAKPSAASRISIETIFPDAAARKAMGLDKLDQEEQRRLTKAIVDFAIPLRSAELRRTELAQDAVRYLTRQGWEEDPTRKMRDEGWEEVEVIGVVAVKGDQFTLDRELLAARVVGKKQYYGSGFRDELNRWDKANLRRGMHWGKDMFHSLTLIGIDGSEVELRKIDIDDLR